MNKYRWVGVSLTAVILTLLFILIALPQPTQAQEAEPTVDRLAAPPTVLAPTQADEGAQLYWLYCQPCHGDVGQGLTDEWRAQYPEEEQNCWQSGCHSAHGKDLPEFGFVLPTAVPAITGEGSLPGFATAGQLYAYISSQMPYELPGKLTENEYLALTAHLAREHGIWDGTELNKENIGEMRLQPLSIETPTPLPPRMQEGSITELPFHSTTAQSNELSASVSIWSIGGIVGITAIVILGSMWVWRRRN